MKFLSCFFVGRRSHRLRAGVWGTAGGDHLPRGVARGQNHHELPRPGQPTCHIQVTYASFQAPCLHRLTSAKTRSTSEWLWPKHQQKSDVQAEVCHFTSLMLFFLHSAFQFKFDSKMFIPRKRSCFAHSFRFDLKIYKTRSGKYMWWYFI